MRSRMPHRVTVQSLTESVDSYGTVTETWADERDAWANVRTLNGTELQLVGRTHPVASYVVEMHHDPANVLTTKKRIVFGSKYLDIEHVENRGNRDRWIKAYCSATES